MYLCSQRSTPRISLGQIPKGYAGTKQTVAYITGLIKEGAKDFCVRQTRSTFSLRTASHRRITWARSGRSLPGSKTTCGIPAIFIASNCCTRRDACWSCGLAIAMT